MSIAVADIIEKVGILLSDVGNVRWTNDEVIGWINDSSAAIIDARPMAGAVTEVITLVDGVVQNFDCVELLDIVRNELGRTIVRTNRFLLDVSDPDWMAGDKVDSVEHYTYDERFRTQCYVYPPVNAGTRVEALLAKLPAVVTSIGDTLDLSAEYTNAVINYTLYRCYGKDDEVGNGSISMGYLSTFNGLLGLKNNTSLEVSPKRSEP